MPYEVYYGSNCEEEVLNHNCSDCPDIEKARSRDVGYIHKDYYPVLAEDPTDASLWQDGITGGHIKVIPQVLGETDGGTEELGQGYGDVDETLLGYTHTAFFKDPNYKENCGFYDSLKNNKSYHFFYKTETQVHISGAPVQSIPKNPVTNELQDDVTWDVTVKWFQKTLVCPHDMPDGIIDCFTLAPA